MRMSARGRRRWHGREPGDGGGPQGAAEPGVFVDAFAYAVAVEDRVDDMAGELGRAVVVAVEVNAEEAPEARFAAFWQSDGVTPLLLDVSSREVVST